MKRGNVPFIKLKNKTGCKIACTELHRKFSSREYFNIVKASVW